MNHGRDIDLRYQQHYEPEPKSATKKMFLNSSSEDVDLRYSDPREELASMGLLPSHNEIKGLDNHKNNEDVFNNPAAELAAMGLLPQDNPEQELASMGLLPQQHNPAAELAAMGLLPQGNLGGRPGETECVARGARTGPTNLKGSERSSERTSSHRSSRSSPRPLQRSQSPQSDLRTNHSSRTFRENSPRSRRSFPSNSDWNSSSREPRRSFSPRSKRIPLESERKRLSPRISNEKLSSFGASRKRSSSPSSSSRKRTPPKEVTHTASRMNISHHKEKKLDSEQQPGNFDADDACNMLMVICDKLGVIGVSFKSVLKKALEFEPDTHKMLEVFHDSDTLSLMEVVANRINDLVEHSKNNYEKEIMKKAFLNVRALIDKSKKAGSEIVHGVDISRVAHITFGKETSHIIHMIKTGLEYGGVVCTQGMLSEIYQKVSMQHFSITKANENHKKMLNTKKSMENNNRVGVSELLRSESEKSKAEPLGLTESLMQGVNNELKSDRGEKNNFNKRGLEHGLPYRGNIREKDKNDHPYRDRREIDERKDLLQQKMHYRDEREHQGRRDKLDVDRLRQGRRDRVNEDMLRQGLPNRYARDDDRSRDRINQNQTNRDEKEKYRINGLNHGDTLRDGRDLGIGRGASRKDLHHRDARDSNRRDKPYTNLQFRDSRENYMSWCKQSSNDKFRPKFWEQMNNKQQDRPINEAQIPNETFEEDTRKMPTVQEMMEDLERMQAMAEAEKDNEPEEEEDHSQEEFDNKECNDDAEEQRDDVNEDNETKSEIQNKDELDDNLKETFGNKDIAEVSWQDIVKKLAPEDMIKPTDMDDAEHNENNDDNNPDDSYGYENYNNYNYDPDNKYMKSEDNNRGLDQYYNNQNVDYRHSEANDGNYNPDLMIPAQFIKDRRSVDEHGITHHDGSSHSHENSTNFSQYQGQNHNNYGEEQDVDYRNNYPQYEGNQNYPEQRMGNTSYEEQGNLGSSHEYGTNGASSYAYGEGYGGESLQSTNDSYRAQSEAYNAYEYNPQAKESYKYDAGVSAYYLGGPSLESQQPYSQTIETNSNNYKKENSQTYESDYQGASSYQQQQQQQQYNESSNHPYDDSGYEAESSEYSVEMPVQFIKPKTSNDSFQNPPAESNNSWLRDQIKSLATSNLGKEDLAARISQIMANQNK